MKISFITPTAYIKDYGTQGQFILALSHLIKLDEETDYERELKASGMELYLDNGLFENKIAEPIETLIQKALKIGAKLVFLPDVLYNSQETLKNVEKHAKFVREKGLKVGVVVQASNEEDWLELYDKFVVNPEVDLIGISILSVPKSFGGSIVSSRIKLLKKLIERGNNTKDLHMLGMGEGGEDLQFAKQYCPFVVSHDSSSAFWNAMQGKKIVSAQINNLRVEGGKTSIPVDFNFKNATQEQLERAQDNINLIKEKLCHN